MTKSRKDRPAAELYGVLLAPHVTEKATRGSEHNQVAFRVALEATKTDIRQAVEKLFNVKVVAVNTVNVKGKTKRFRGIAGRRSDWKKAIVRLAAGSTIDVSAGI